MNKSDVLFIVTMMFICTAWLSFWLIQIACALDGFKQPKDDSGKRSTTGKE